MSVYGWVREVLCEGCWSWSKDEKGLAAVSKKCLRKRVRWDAMTDETRPQRRQKSEMSDRRWQAWGERSEARKTRWEVREIRRRDLRETREMKVSENEERERERVSKDETTEMLEGGNGKHQNEYHLKLNDIYVQDKTLLFSITWCNTIQHYMIWYCIT